MYTPFRLHGYPDIGVLSTLQTVAALSGKKSSMMMLPSMVDVLPNG